MKYVHKPNQVEAIQWNLRNSDEIIEFVGNLAFIVDNTLHIEMPGYGTRSARIGDFIVKDESGNISIIPAGTFSKKYQETKM